MSERAHRILSEIGEAIDRKRRLPVVRPADAEAVCNLFHADVDRGTAARATAAAAAGHPVACHDGCSQCCNNIPAVFAGEVVTIVRWLDRPENAAARAGFLARYPAWFARVADLIAGWEAATAARDVDGATAAATQAWHRQVMCAFNHEGRCTIYEVRPNVCRNAHALDTPDNCVPHPAAPPVHREFAPLDEYLERVRPMVYAMHASLRGRDGRGSQPLCAAVHEQLAASREVGRNDPCPCGSGKKYKQCHLRAP
jgi:hypothetical protein